MADSVVSTATKTYGIAGVSLFLVGLSLVCLHLVRHAGEVSIIGSTGVFMQAIGSSFIIATLIRAAGGR